MIDMLVNVNYKKFSCMDHIPFTADGRLVNYIKLTTGFQRDGLEQKYQNHILCFHNKLLCRDYGGIIAIVLVLLTSSSQVKPQQELYKMTMGNHEVLVTGFGVLS